MVLQAQMRTHLVVLDASVALEQQRWQSVFTRLRMRCLILSSPVSLVLSTRAASASLEGDLQRSAMQLMQNAGAPQEFFGMAVDHAQYLQGQVPQPPPVQVFLDTSRARMEPLRILASG